MEGERSEQKRYILISDLASETPYSQAYLSLLARRGRIDAKKIGRNWHVSPEGLQEYLIQQGIPVFIPKAFPSKSKLRRPLDPNLVFASIEADTRGAEEPSPIPRPAPMPADAEQTQKIEELPPVPPATPDVLPPLGELGAPQHRVLEGEKGEMGPVEEFKVSPEKFFAKKLEAQKRFEDSSTPGVLPSTPGVLPPALKPVAVVKREDKGIKGEAGEEKGKIGVEGEKREEGEKKEEKGAELEKTLERFVNVLDKRLSQPRTRVGRTVASLNELSAATMGRPRQTRWLMVGLVTIVVIGFVFGGFGFGSASVLIYKAREIIKDATTLQGHTPGTHANEVLLLDKEGKISIYGHIETKGQLRSYVEQGIAPIVVDSTTTVENLSADYLDNVSAEEFTLAFVTKNGSVTTEKVFLEGGVEIGETLLVKSANKLAQAIIEGNLSTLGSVSIGKDLVVNGFATLAGGADIFTKLLVRGDAEITNLIVANRGQIKDGGLMVSGHTQLKTLGVSGGASIDNLGVGNFNAGGNVFLGNSTADELIVNASSTFKGMVNMAEHLFAMGSVRFGDADNDNAEFWGTSLGFNSSATTTVGVTTGLNFDSNTLVLDARANRVGIGTSSPGTLLAVQGTGNIQNDLTVGGVIKANNLATASTTLASGFGTTSPYALLSVEIPDSTKLPAFVVHDQGTSTPAFAVFPNNFVGLSTSTPGSLLSVAGVGNFASLTVEDVLKAGIVTATSSILNGPGSTSSPAYSFLSDSNTGITSGGADDYLSLITGGAVRATIDKNGNVGIATTTPAGALGVTGAGIFEGFLQADYFTSTSSNNSWLLGQLGIGTTTPGNRLGVAGSGLIKGNLTAEATSSVSSLIATSTLEVRGASGSDLVVQDGRVGIGTSTAGQLLSVAGAGLFQNNLTAESAFEVQGTATFNAQVWSADIVASTGGVDIASAGTRLGVLYADEVNATTLVGTISGGNVSAATLAINSDNATADTEDSNLAFERGTVTPNALITWHSGNDQLEINTGIFISRAIDSADNAGYGLDVVGAGRFSTDLDIMGGDINLGTGTATSTLTSASALLGVGSTTPWGVLSVEHIASGDENLPSFVVADQGTTTPSFIVMNASGRVGIATSSPQAALAVGGNSLISGDLTIGGALKVSSFIATTTLQVGAGSTSSPAYSFTTDPDTGITSGGADNMLSIITGGAVRGVVDKSGNVGIGTTSPSTKFSVGGAAGDTTGHGYFTGGLGVGILNTTANTLRVGQCVTGDTKLRRRRRRRRRISNSQFPISNDDEYIYDEVAIKNVQPGDEILSLNEKTGLLEWQPVRALYDMGEQPVYRIKTASGKTIRTTSSHPYLTKWGWVAVGDLRKGNEIACPIESEGLFGALPRREALARLGLAQDRMQSSQDLLHRGFRQAPQYLANQALVNGNNFAKFYHRWFGQAGIALLGFVETIFNVFGTVLKMRGDRGYDDVALAFVESGGRKNESRPLFGSRQVRKGKRDEYDFAGFISSRRWHRRDYSRSQTTVQRVSTAQCRQDAISRGAADASKTAAVPPAWPVRLPLQFSLKRVWLALRSIITAVFKESSATMWDKIVAIEYTGIEHVWDISVKNTYNFVANGIIAHNTAFIVDSSGSVGVGTINPSQALEVATTGRFGTTLDVGTDLQVYGGDINLGTGSATTTITSSSGNLGIGTTSPGALLSVQGASNVGSLTVEGVLKASTLSATSSIQVGAGSTSSPAYSFVTDTDTGITSGGADNMLSLITGGSVRSVIDKSGNVGIGTVSPGTILDVTGTGRFSTSVHTGTASALDSDLTVLGTSALVTVMNPNAGYNTMFVGNNANVNGPAIAGFKTRSTGTDANTIVQSGDTLMRLQGFGADGATYREAAKIQFEVDGTPGVADMPTRITFRTTPDGSATMAERMRIDSAGNVGIGTTTPGALLSVQGASNVGSLTVEGVLKASTLSATSSIQVGAGSTSSPAYSFTTDTDTGITSGGADNMLSLVTGGSARATIDKNGDIDIGGVASVISPSYKGKVTITGDSSTFNALNLETTVSGYVDLGFSIASSNKTGIIRHIYEGPNSERALAFFVMDRNAAVQEVMRLSTVHGGSPSAMVGIGTTSPQNTLHLHMPSGRDAAITLTATSSKAVFDWTIGIDNSDVGKFKIASSTALGTSDRFVIDTSGNVGIGTTTPGTLLSVQGASNVGSLTVEGVLKTGSLVATSTTSGFGTTTPYALLSVEIPADTKLPAFAVHDQGTSTPAFAVMPSGRVGIGTAKPRSILDLVVGADNNEITLQANPGQVLGGLFFRDGPGSAGTDRQAYFQYGTGPALGESNNRFQWSTKNVAGTEAVKMTLDQEGRFGVGTTSPGGLFSISAATSVPAFLLNQTETGDLLTLQDGGTTAFVVKDGGNIGIGTTTPGALLSVQGASNVGSLTVEGVLKASTLSATSSIQVGAGSTSSPAYSFTTDTDTGITSGGADNMLSLITGGTTRLIIDKNGNTNIDSGVLFVDAVNNRVGIGTTSPDSFFVVSGVNSRFVNYDGQANIILDTAGATSPQSQIIFRRKGSNFGIIRANYDDLTLRFDAGTASGFEQMVLTSNGRLGIGRTSPNTALDVVGAGTFSTDLNVLGGDINLGTGSATSTLTSSGGLLGLASTTPWGLFSIEATTDVNSRTPIFVVGDAGTTTPFLYVSGNNGNVGIGTARPNTGLTVNKRVQITGSAPTPTAGAGFEISYSSGTNAGIIQTYDRDASVYRDMELTGASIVFGIGGVEKMRLASTGNVGIGTTTPGTLLSVQDEANIGSLTVEGILKAGTLMATSSIQNAAGSTSSPAYSFTTDTDTGITSGGADNMLSLITGGSVRAVVDKNGNVGIGHTNPQEALTVSGNAVVGHSDNVIALGAAASRFEVHENGNTLNTAGLFRWGSGGSPTLSGVRSRSTTLGTPGTAVQSGDGLLVLTGQGDDGTNLDTAVTEIRFAVDGTVSNNVVPGRITFSTAPTSGADAITERMRIDSSGNVGIGTTTPGAILDVRNSAAGNASGQEVLRLNASFNGSVIGSGAVLNFNDLATTYARIHAATEASGGVTGLAFYTHNGTSLGERVRINNSGNVGIGTTTPGALLAVEGSGVVRDNFFVGGVLEATSTVLLATDGGNVGIGTANPTELLHVSSNSDVTDVRVQVETTSTNSNRQPLLRLKNQAGNFSQITFSQTNYSGGGDSLFLQNESGGAVIFIIGTSGGEKVRITPGGELGIATSSPWGLLAVEHVATGTENFPAFVVSDQGTSTPSLIVMNASGNVGIGTTTPGTLLSVQGASNVGSLTVEGILKAGTLMATSSVLNALGSSSSPAYSFVADSDTGITSAGADNALFFVTGGSDRMVIDKSGRVGIGTANPGVKLGAVISDTGTTLGSSGIVLNVANSNITTNNIAAISFGNVAGGAGWSQIGAIYTDHTGNSEDQDIFFRTIAAGSASEKMRITNTGNVGIGTAGPSSKLQVGAANDASVGSSFGQTAIAKEVVGGGLTNLLSLYTSRGASTAVGANDGGKITWFGQYRNHATDWATQMGEIGMGKTNATDANYSSYMYFSTRNSGSAVAEAMRIDSAGNVGIGTTSPGALLSVQGAGNVGSLTVEGVLKASTLSATSSIQVGAGSTSSPAYSFTTDTDTGLTSGGADNMLSLITGGSVRAVVDKNGNVGIGTAAPEDLLHVRKANSGAEQILMKLTNAATAVNTAATLSFSNTTSDDDQVKLVAKRTDSPSAGDTELQFHTFGSGALGQRMVIGTTGNVGIGTTTPAKVLQIASTGSAQLMLTDTSAGTDLKHWYASSSAGNLTIGSANDRLTSWTERVRIDSSGNVQFSPTNLAITSNTTDGSDNKRIMIGGGGTISPSSGAYIQMFGNEYTGDPGELYLVAGNVSSAFIAMDTQDTERMRITYGGNVGIGTTTPGTLLSVQDEANIGALTVEGVLKTGALYATSSASGFATTTPWGVLSVEQIDSGDELLPAFVVADQGTSTPSLIVMNGTGNVGIGTANPSVIVEVVKTLTGVSGGANSKALYLNLSSSGNDGGADLFANHIVMAAGYIGAVNTAGVRAENNIASTGTNYGVQGYSLGTGTTNVGGYFTATGATNNYGLIVENGNVGIASTTPRARLGIEGASTTPALLIRAGNTTGDGAIAISVASADLCDDNGTPAGCALNDIAELFPAEAGIQPGDVVAFGSGLKLTKASTTNALAGVISTAPAIVIEGNRTLALSGFYSRGSGKAPLAIAGRVPVKIASSSPAISTGDFLTVSPDAPGFAAKATEAGYTIGKALEAYDPSNPPAGGKISMFVNLTWFAGESVQLAGSPESFSNVTESISNSGSIRGNSGWIREGLANLWSVAKSTLASIANTLYTAANSVLAASTQLAVSSEDAETITYETYNLQSTRGELIASGSATLVMMPESANAVVHARIRFDESFTALIDESEPIKVIVTPTTKLNGGLYVHEKTIYGFEVREINAQDEGGMFDWIVIARTKANANDPSTTLGAGTNPDTNDTNTNPEPISPISPIGPIEPVEAATVTTTTESAPTETATTTEPAPVEETATATTTDSAATPELTPEPVVEPEPEPTPVPAPISEPAPATEPAATTTVITAE